MLRDPGHAAGAGHAAAQRRPAGRHRRRTPRSASPRRWRSPTCRCAASSTKRSSPYEDRRGHAADRRQARRRGLRAGRHLTVGDFRDWLLSRCRHRRCAGRARARPHAGDGGGGLQDHAQPGPDRRGREDAASSPASATPSACPAGSPRACSPTTRPTTRAASPPACSTACCYGCGDAVIGINPATDSVRHVHRAAAAARRRDRQRYEIPTQSCVLAHVTTTLEAIERGAPVDLVFQSIAGTEAANRSFGIDLALLARGAATRRCR